MTLDHVEVILPNASLAKAAIRNYSRPSPVSRRGRRRRHHATPSAPNDVHAVLVAAARRRPRRPRRRRAPFARTQAFGDSAIDYDVFFFIDDFGARAARSTAPCATASTTQLARRGIEIPFPTRTVILVPRPTPQAKRDAERGRRAAAIARRRAALRRCPTTRARSSPTRARCDVYGPGEAIVRKGEAEPRALRRRARARWPSRSPRDGGGVAEVAQLGVGQCFGEMGLLTGEVALRHGAREDACCDLVVVDHDAFHDVLAAHPEVVERMGGLLARGKPGSTRPRRRGRAAQPPEERSRRLISQIREFFKLV